jgi:hypothetical protein
VLSTKYGRTQWDGVCVLGAGGGRSQCVEYRRGLHRLEHGGCTVVCCFFDRKVSTVHPIFNLRDVTERTRENGLIPHGPGWVSDRFTGESMGRNIHGYAKNRARKGHPKKSK